jgi:putative two-component system response regulator
VRARSLGSGEDCTVGFENRYRTRDGSYRWLAWTSRAVPGDDLIYATARDVTDRHEQHVELERLVGDRTRELQAARFENLRRLALAAEYRDDDTQKHTERVGALARLLGEQLGLSDEFTDQLRHAAPLHDVGKLGVPDAILLKPGRLTDEERLLMQNHTLMGADILAGSNFPVLQLGTEIALTQHERWDGAGYPAGTAGEAIPISGRIVAVADVFDALTHERPYKPAWPLEEAVAEIMAGSATQFDAAVVAAFQALHEQGILPAFVQAAPASQLAKRTRQAAAA